MTETATDLTRALDRLVAEEAIRWTSARLPQLFDARSDIEHVVDCFTADAEVTLSVPARRWHGPEQIADALGRIRSEWQGTATYVTNLAVAWEGDLAVATSYVQCWVWRQDSREQGDRRPADRVHTCAAEDLFVLEDEQWRIRSRRLRHLGPDGVGI